MIKKIVLLPLLFIAFLGHTQNRFPVLIDGKYGYIDKQGTLVIDAKFVYGRQFKNGFAIVEQANAKNIIIDTLGTKLTDFSFPYYWSLGVEFYSEGLFVVYDQETERLGYMDASGNWVIPPKYFTGLNFSDGLAAVWEDPDRRVDEGSGCGTPVFHSKWGFINRQGDYVIEPKYSEVSNFINGIAITGQGEMINKQGAVLMVSQVLDTATLYRRMQYKRWIVDGEKVSIPHHKDDFEGCSVLARVITTNKFGFIDFNGNWVIAPTYDEAKSFSEGLAGVQIKGQWGYMDCQGKIVIPFQYESVAAFSEGLAAVQKNGKWGFIDSSGLLVIPFEYDWLSSFEDHLVQAEKNGKMMYLNRTGDIIWQEQ